MKICIVSDSHDRGPELATAIGEAQAMGAQAVIHCGDVIGGNTLRAALKIGLPLHVVHGNNVGDPVSIMRQAAKSEGMLHYYGHDADIELGGRRIFFTHYPHLARGMACTGDYDLVCCGHTHKAEIAPQSNICGGHTWLVNPGTVAGIGGAPATFVLGDLSLLDFTLHTLS